MSSIAITLVVIAAAVALGIALAYLPMRLLLSHIAKNVREFIQRQRDRRSVVRETPDRRTKEDEAKSAAAAAAPPSATVSATTPPLPPS